MADRREIWVTLTTGAQRHVFDANGEGFDDPQQLLDFLRWDNDVGERPWVLTDFGAVRADAILEVFALSEEYKPIQIPDHVPLGRGRSC